MRVERLSSKSTRVGRRVSFMCEAYQGDNVKFTWTKNGSLLKTSSQIIIASNVASSTLTILNAGAFDAGSYTCIASNRASEDRASATLEVEGRLTSADHPSGNSKLAASFPGKL